MKKKKVATSHSRGNKTKRKENIVKKSHVTGQYSSREANYSTHNRNGQTKNKPRIDAPTIRRRC